MSRKFMTAALFAVLMLAPRLAQAADKYELDASHTYVGFAVTHLGLSTTYGAFRDLTGNLLIDEASPEKSSVNVTMQTKSVDTGHAKRDEHLRGKDFFNVEQFPTMTFRSTEVKPTGKTTARVTGDLTMLGVIKPVTLDVKFNAKKEYPRTKKMAVGFEAQGKLKRSDFGLSQGIPMVGDEIVLTISTEAQQSD